MQCRQPIQGWWRGVGVSISKPRGVKGGVGVGGVGCGIPCAEVKESKNPISCLLTDIDPIFKNQDL